MKKWVFRTVVAGALLSACFFVVFRWLTAEPEYYGRPLSQWVSDLQNGNAAARQQAAEVIKEMGPEGLPYLSGTLTNPPTPLQKLAATARPHVPKSFEAPLRRLYDPPNEIVEKIAALKALQTMGTNGAEALPAIEQIFRQSNVGLSSAAAQALAQMGTNAVPILVAALDDGDYNIRANACYAMAELRTNAAPAIPRLARFARDEQGPIVSMAFYALSRTGAAAVPELTEMLSNTNASVRSQALYALGTIGVGSLSSIPQICEATEDPVPEVRWRAVETLARIDGELPEAQKAMVAALSDPDATVRATGAKFIFYRQRLARNNLDKLKQLLSDPSPGVRAEAARAIGQTGKWGAPALETLRRLYSDTNELVSARARRAVEIINEATKTKSTSN